MPAALTDDLIVERGGALYKSTALDLVKLVPVFATLGGRFLLDPNEFVGLGIRGPYDDNHTTDLGNVGAAPARTAGGWVFPFDVQPKRLFAWHRNTNAAAQAWGWRIHAQTKTAGANTKTDVDILRECTGTGATAVAPRDYLSNVTQQSDVDLTGAAVVPAGTVIGLGVEAPTANTTNYYVEIMSGYMEFERV